MAVNKQITIPDLVPGKRYRLVVGKNTSNGEILSPAIEFSTPTSPVLMTEYGCDVNRVFTTTTVKTGTATAPAVYKYVNIVSWSRTDGSNIFTFYTDAAEKAWNGSAWEVSNATGLTPTAPQPFFKIYDISSGTHEYYDRMKYKVTSLTGASNEIITCTASYDTSFSLSGHPLLANMNSALCHTGSGTAHYPYATGQANYPTDSTLWWKYNDGRSMKTALNVANAGKLCWTIPSYNYDTYGTQTNLDVKITVPTSVPLAWTSTVRDIPYFVYIDQFGNYYSLMDGENFKQFDGTLLSYSTTSMPTSVIRTTGTTATSGYVKNLPNQADLKIYKFTIARYTLQGSTWVGDWLQYDRSQAPTKDTIVWSQNGVVTG